MKYELKPPNHENLELYAIVNPITGKRFHLDPENPYHPWLSASDFEGFLQQHAPTILLLEEVWSSNWSHAYRKKLRSHLQKTYLHAYMPFQESVKLERFQAFWLNCPEYGGGYLYQGRRYGKEDVQWHGVPPQPFPLETHPPILQARTERLFEDSLPLITDWCMASFSQNRDAWDYVSCQPIDIQSYIVTETTHDQPKSRVLTEEQKAARLARRILAKLKREGKISQQVQEELLDA